MLKLIKHFDELNVAQLVSVYAESIALDGKRQYPDLPENLQILQAEQDFYAFLDCFFHEPHAVYAIWDADGGYKAALRLEEYEDGLLMSGLETASWARGRGYAAMLVEGVIAELAAMDDMKLYSHVELSNLPSMALHIKCGFHQILDYAVYLDGTIKRNACTFCMHIKKTT